MKGLILAAGKGTRLYPMTKPMSKPLLPVYDKPMIYYPLAILMQAGISDVMVIVPPNETDTFRALLGNGSQFGISICYAEQPVARGIADALLIGREFVGDDSVCLVLGDNIFHSDTLAEVLRKGAQQQNGATVFGYWVENPRPFGVVEFDEDGRAISIEEKPRHGKRCGFSKRYFLVLVACRHLTCTKTECRKMFLSLIAPLTTIRLNRGKRSNRLPYIFAQGQER